MIRTTDPDVIEHRLLELAYTTDAKITPAVLAYFAPCSIEDAERVLDDLTARDRIRMDVDDEGTITYSVPDRQRLPPPPHPPRATSLVHLQQLPLAIRRGRTASPALAAVFSMFVPGAGQLYAGRAVAALMWFLVVSAGYALILPGLVLHLFCIVSAANSANQLNSEMTRLQLHAG